MTPATGGMQSLNQMCAYCHRRTQIGVLNRIENEATPVVGLSFSSIQETSRCGNRDQPVVGTPAPKGNC